MTATNFSPALRNARSQAISDAIGAGTGPGTINFLTTPRPAAGAAITTQMLLATVICADPAGTVVNGALTFSSIADDSLADNTGDADWVRVYDSDGNWVIDMDVTDEAGAGPVKMISENPGIPATHIYQGGIVKFATLVIMEGN
jgi:hypothetical protein